LLQGQEGFVTHEGLAIEGIDTQGALKRLGGKRELYERLLRKFADKQANAVVAVRAALASGDVTAAEREVHSLRGAASSLGANALAEAAAKTEQLLKEGSHDEVTLRHLEDFLGAVVHAIHSKLAE
jgi:two-component system, sensor histidine kinase and response regulator